MLHRYTFLFVIFGMLGLLTYLSDRVEPSLFSKGPALHDLHAHAEDENSPQATSIRSDLFEVLDRLVCYEHYYHSVYGNFTQLISRVGVPIPSAVSEVYEIRIAEASRDRLLVSAFSETNGKTFDFVTVNQDFEVYSEFPAPTPRLEYLQGRAQKHLRILKDSPAGWLIAEQGIFRGFFRYDLRREGDRGSIVAVGLKPPVLGVQLESKPEAGPVGKEVQDPLLSQLLPEFPENANNLTGQKSAGTGMTTQEEAVLAQKIYYGEVGRYARDWTELARITRFRFEEREFLTRGLAGAGKGESTELVPMAAEEKNQAHAGGIRSPSTFVNGFEIESVSSEGQ